MAKRLPTLALLGAGHFARDVYVAALRKISHLITVSFVWSRSQTAAQEVAAMIREFAPAVEARWGEDALLATLDDPHLDSVALVLPAQVQPRIAVEALKRGKHVLQEKPVGTTFASAVETLQAHRSLSAGVGKAPIWAVAENYRFEPGLRRAGEIVKELGDMLLVQLIIESPMNSKNKYFTSEWRRDPGFTGSFLTDSGVHFIGGLRLVTGCEVVGVSAVATHIDKGLSPPDNLTASFLLSNGCGGVMAMSYTSTLRKICWRVVATGGTLEVERTVVDKQHGYNVTVWPKEGALSSKFFPFEGVDLEIEAFAEDLRRVASQSENFVPNPLGSHMEAIADLAVVDAMMASGLGDHGWTKVEPIPDP